MGVSPLTEAGYIRLATNPKASFGVVYFPRVFAVLADLTQKPGYCFWPIADSWAALTAPFADRIFGHRQVTDAYLLGLAIKSDGVLVTFDRGLKYMAGAEFSRESAWCSSSLEFRSRQRFHNCCTSKPLPLSGFFSIKSHLA